MGDSDTGVDALPGLHENYHDTILLLLFNRASAHSVPRLELFKIHIKIRIIFHQKCREGGRGGVTLLPDQWLS